MSDIGSDELLSCVEDLLDSVYKLHPQGAVLRKRSDTDLEQRLNRIGANIFDPRKTIRRVLVARKLIKEAR